nr:hypothetical protein [Tanacetum cinerariifolium]
KEKIELEVKVTDLAASVKVGEQEFTDLDAMVTSVKLQNDCLADQVHKLEASSAGLQEKVTVLRWLLTHDMELAIAKCLNSTEYHSALGAAIGKSIEKGMQEGLSAGITHGTGGRTLTDVVTYNPSVEADYLSALQCLQSVNFPLIMDLKTNKDASVEVIMNLLRLEDALAEKLGLVESHPHVDQLMVPIHHSPNQRVVDLYGVFVPLSEPLSAMALEGTEGTSGAAPDTTTALSGEEGAVADVEAVADEGADPFLDVSDAELDVLE